MRAAIKKEIPNMLTLCNLLCGCASILCAFSSNPQGASLFIFLSAVFDFFDGMAARLLGVAGPLGVELDSLSDVVSFGAAPAFLAYQMVESQSVLPGYLSAAVLLMAAASAYRLAKFNVDKTQRGFFKGMPTPANALFWASLGMYWHKEGMVLDAWYLLGLSLLLSFLLVCNFRMFAFKGRDWSWKGKRMVYLYLLAVAALFCIFGFLGLAAGVLLYPCFSWLHFRFDRIVLPGSLANPDPSSWKKPADTGR